MTTLSLQERLDRSGLLSNIRLALLRNDAVEAVARAICQANGYDPDSLLAPREPFRGYQFILDDEPHAQWEFFRGDARAAIRAASEYIRA